MKPFPVTVPLCISTRTVFLGRRLVCGCMVEEAKILYHWYGGRGEEEDGYEDGCSNDGVEECSLRWRLRSWISRG